MTLPAVRGTLTEDRPMADLTWLRVGGPADWLFQPADEADLAAFLRRCRRRCRCCRWAWARTSSSATAGSTAW